MKAVAMLMLAVLFCSVQSTALAQLKSFACTTKLPGAAVGMTASWQVADSTQRWMFRAGFDAENWTGSLEKYAASLLAGKGLTLAPTAVWDAADQWRASPSVSPAPSATRNIYTSDSRTGNTIVFEWLALSGQQQQWLNRSPLDNRIDGLGEQRVRYLRGQQSVEAGSVQGLFRSRTTLLGPILNSRPVVDDGIVYVGANDGMLHGFSAESGTELFAYVPGFLLPTLAQLTSAGQARRAWVDGALTVQPVTLSGHPVTVLAGTAGTGARGVFALDISHPAAFGKEGGVLWEFSDADDPDMGYVTGLPGIGRFQTGKGSSQYFVIVASDLLHSGVSSASGASQLFLLALDKPAAARWQLNVNYFKLGLPADAVAPAQRLSSPALVLADNGTVRFAYAGDLQGQLWRFDFTGGAPWQAARRLFSATDQSARPQPIVAQPKVVFAPGGYLVLFGTGRLLEPAEGLPSGFATQSFYAVRDTAAADQPPVARADLAVRTLQKIDGDQFRIEGTAFQYGSGKLDRLGWYLDFPDSRRMGERLVDSPLSGAGHVAFRSLIPAADGCDRGAGRTYMLAALDGLTSPGSAIAPRSVMKPSSALTFLTQSIRAERNATGGASLMQRVAVWPAGDAGQGEGEASLPGATVLLPVRRLGWREIGNWREMHRAAGAR